MPNASRYLPFSVPLAVVVHHVTSWGGEEKLCNRGRELYVVASNELPSVLEYTIRQDGSERFFIPRNLLNRGSKPFLAIRVAWWYPTFVVPEFATA